MRSIENKKLVINITHFNLDTATQQLEKVSAVKETTYFESLVDMLKVAPKEGWSTTSLDKLETRLNLITELNKKGKSLLLEETQYKEIIEALTNWRYFTTTVDCLNFMKYIKDLPEENLNSKSSLKKVK